MDDEGRERYRRIVDQHFKRVRQAAKSLHIRISCRDADRPRAAARQGVNGFSGTAMLEPIENDEGVADLVVPHVT